MNQPYENVLTPIPITLVVVCDNHYLILLAALIKSIEVNHTSSEKLFIYIVEDGVTKKNKAKLQDSINQSVTTVYWLNMKKVIPKGMKLPLDYSTYPLNIYMRLFIPYFVPKEVDRVIYLDVDMIVLKDISLLWKVDIQNNVIGAVLDPGIKTFGNSWGGIQNFKELGLNSDTKYFNTGLLLIDTQKWRLENLTEKIIDCIEKNKKFSNYPDQYGLNVTLSNKWKEIDSRWNFFCNSTHIDPFIIHFVQRKPIYKTYNNNLVFRELFYDYLNLTKWKNTNPIGESSRYLKKLNNVFVKVVQTFGFKS